MEKVNIGNITLGIQPEKQIEFTSGRSFAQYNIPGSKPVFQDMGEQEQSCKFDGVIHEENALAKIRELKKIQDNGEVVSFVYGAIDVKILIRSFGYKFIRADYMCYSIELLLIDETQLSNNGSNEIKPELNSSKRTELAETVKKDSMSSALDKVSTIHQPIRQGDCLRTVALKYCGSPRKWQTIAMLNKLTGVNIEGLKFLKIPSDDLAWNEVDLIMDAQQNKLPADAYVYVDGGRGK